MDLPTKIKSVYSRATCLYTKEQIETALDKMAHEISVQLADKNPIFLCVVIGGIVTLGNLLPRLDFPLEVDYIHATRYRSGTKGGELEWRAVPSQSLTDRVVVIVDDFLDQGVTLQATVDYCKEKGAKAVLVAALLEKDIQRKPSALQHADFVGLTVEDVYIFGYGLDYQEYLRNVPGIYAVANEDR